MGLMQSCCPVVVVGHQQQHRGAGSSTTGDWQTSAVATVIADQSLLGLDAPPSSQIETQVRIVFARRSAMRVQGAILPTQSSLNSTLTHKYGSLAGDGQGTALKLTTKARTLDELPDAYSPAFDSPLRESSSWVATFNLLSTILGGGALSLPYAFCKCGWLGGLLVLAFSVQISTVALALLCTLARKLGCATYSDILLKSLGRRWAVALDAISCSMLFFVIVAFLILIKDIAAAVIEYLLLQESEVLSNNARSRTLYCITACMFPLMIQPSLHALRHVSYVGTASVMLLLCVIAYKAASKLASGEQEQMRMGPQQPSDVLSALPIILIAFLCQFNVVSVYAKLAQPTGAHIHRVLQYTTHGSGLIYLLFGVAGYLIAFDATQDNILNNFPSRDPALVAARLGLVFTLMCQTPMVTLPCVDSLLMLVEHCRRGHPGDYSPPPFPVDNDTEGAGGESQVSLSSSARSSSSASSSSWRRSLATLILVLICLILSEKAPGVAFIWTVAGSSISLTLAFLFPSLAYISTWLRLGSDTRQVDASLLSAVALFLVSIFMILLCSAQTIISLRIK